MLGRPFLSSAAFSLAYPLPPETPLNLSEPGPKSALLQGFHHKRRFLPPTTHLMFVSSGDGNGVIHWLGTTYGKQAWMNPLLGGMVKVQICNPLSSESLLIRNLPVSHTDPCGPVSPKEDIQAT